MLMQIPSALPPTACTFSSRDRDRCLRAYVMSPDTRQLSAKHRLSTRDFHIHFRCYGILKERDETSLCCCCHVHLIQKVTVDISGRTPAADPPLTPQPYDTAD